MKCALTEAHRACRSMTSWCSTTKHSIAILRFVKYFLPALQHTYIYCIYAHVIAALDRNAVSASAATFPRRRHTAHTHIKLTISHVHTLNMGQASPSAVHFNLTVTANTHKQEYTAFAWTAVVLSTVRSRSPPYHTCNFASLYYHNGCEIKNVDVLFYFTEINTSIIVTSIIFCLISLLLIYVFNCAWMEL